MTLFKKVDTLFEEKNNKRLSMRSKADYKDPQSHICQIGKGDFQLYSETSKFATGSALYQIQNGQTKLIAYASKRMPEAAKNYSITE